MSRQLTIKEREISDIGDGIIVLEKKRKAMEGPMEQMAIVMLRYIGEKINNKRT